jgi:hypothetical protein
VSGAQAVAAAAELAALQEHAPVRPARVRLDSFDKFSRASKRQQRGEQERGGGQAGAQQREAKRSKSAEQHQASKHSAAGGSGDGSRQGEQPVDVAAAVAAAAAAGAGADAAADPTEAAAKQLREFVKVMLKPRFQAKELDNDDCKWVLGRVVAKVMEASGSLPSAAAPFMAGSRVQKVCGLIDSYVGRRRAELKAAKKAGSSGGGGGSKAAKAGVGPARTPP